MLNRDDGFIKLSNGSFPIVGKHAFSKRIPGKPDIKTITWRLEKSETSLSGDLGCSWGNWKFVTKNILIMEITLPIWKKSIHGRWKMLLDGGNNTPKPKDQ